ncbi:MAG: DNA-directed RNA polymerase subunit alpha [bacterium]
MSDTNIILPSKPRILKEAGFAGTYEIDGLYPGYGHTLGNSLRRIILSSLPGAAITSIKIKGVSHEFSTISGVKEDVINIILNLKKVRIAVTSEEPQILSLKIKGTKDVVASDIKTPGQVRILNPEMHIAHLTDKSAELDMELVVERGLGYVTKEVLQKEKVDIGTITLDAIFTPIRRVSYEVENMRVGNRTDFNRLKMFIETDGTVAPKEALEKSIEIMITQLKAIVGFKEEEEEIQAPISAKEIAKEKGVKAEAEGEEMEDFLKTRTESLDISSRTINALVGANIRTVGGLARKREEDLSDIEGLGSKGIEEIKSLLSKHGISFK